MPFVPATNTLECELRYQQDDQKLENTLYFSFTSPWTIPMMQTLGTELIAWWAIELGPQTSDNVVLREVYITDLSTVSSPAITVVPLLLTQGTRAQPALPNNVSLTVSFRTDSRGRSFRGRNFFVGLCEDQVSQNTVDPSVLTALVAAYNDLLPGGTLTRGEWSVVSRFSGVDPVTGAPIPRAAAVVTPITSVLIVDDTVDSQRRRLPGRGR